MRAESFATVLRRVAKRHDFEVEHFETQTVTGQILVEDAAALTQLALLIERAENWQNGHELIAACRQIAAGFDPNAALRAGVPAPSVHPPEIG